VILKRKSACPAKAMYLGLFMILVAIAASYGTSQAKDITAEELRRLISEETSLVVVVDTRTEYEFLQGHLPRAINISLEKFHLLSSLLPRQKDTPLVFYCRGVG